MADSKEKLFSDFSPVSTEQWMEKITADLKGADFEKKLVWRTNEGFKVKPFYRKEDLKDLKTTDALPGEFPYLRGNKKDNNSWLVRQEINVDDVKAVLNKVEQAYLPLNPDMNKIDGLSMDFGRWRFNLRGSNTEPVLRLNVETRADKNLLEEKTTELLKLIRA